MRRAAAFVLGTGSPQAAADSAKRWLRKIRKRRRQTRTVSERLDDRSNTSVGVLNC
jgi:hypothetical protein